MQKFNFTLILILLCLGMSAQYKKASFFGKEGRTYGIGTRFFALGDGRAKTLGYYLAFGRDRDEKQFFSSWEIQFIPSYKFSYSTTDINDVPLTVFGKSKSHIVYSVNYGFHLLKNKNDEQKLKPYVTAGFNFVLRGGVKESTNDNWDNKKVVMHETFSFGFGGGLGCFINIAPKFSLKLEGGYTYQINTATVDYGEEELYYMFPPHPYGSLGLRYRLISE
ncbi:MAG TPA: hypothetical protein VFO70_03315 [Chitinophagaceae bacterium]|nr:hypothetical protein [Chitinophagaceae bacterium]